jgi:hypothetical protein
LRSTRPLVYLGSCADRGVDPALPRTGLDRMGRNPRHRTSEERRAGMTVNNTKSAVR